MIRWVLILFLFVAQARSASYYVDCEAVGTGTGLSWANAWTSSTAVNWTTVQPGDTVFVSGGTTSKVYTNDFIVGRDGSLDNYVRIRIGQDAGHNGVAIFEGCTLHPNGNRPKWNWIDGGRDASFVAPTNYQQVVSGVFAITNNIGFWCRNLTGTNNSVTSPAVWYMRNPDNCKFSWIEISGLTNTGDFEFAENRGTVCYIDAGDEAGNGITNNVFEYLYLHHNMGQQFAVVSSTPTGFSDLEWRFCYLFENGEDHWETSGGVTIRDSVIGPCYPNGVHNDFFQFTGSYIKVYNNDIRESQNAIMRIQSAPGGAGTNLTHNIWFYNNLVTEKQGRAIGGGTLVEPFCVVHFDSVSPTHMTIFSNIVFANNLIYNSVLSTAIEPDEMCRNPVMYWSRGQQVTNTQILASKFANNLVVMKHKGITFPVSTNIQPNATYWPHTTNDMWVDYNVFAGTNTSLITTPRQVSYMDVTTNLEFHPFKLENSTNYPVWVDSASDNFELAGADTSSLNTGYDMSDYFTFDALNRARAGTWDRGPLELTETNLLVLLSFDDDFSDSRLDDTSGHGNHGWRFGRTGSTWPTNFPSQVLASVSTGTHSNGLAGLFAWYTNDYGLYGRDGQYAAITNVAELTNLNAMTVCVWARYYPWQSNAAGCTDYTCDQQGALLSAGTSTGVPGTWELARRDFDTANHVRMRVLTNQSTFASQEIHFPDPGFPDVTTGDTATWNHYAFTWSNGVWSCYFNGTNFATGDISLVVTNLIVAANAGVQPWIGVGCYTHGGTPALEDETGVDYPNHGWFNGLMDDARIYNRALSAGEVEGVFAGGATSGSESEVEQAGANNINRLLTRKLTLR